jgi:hypothetical protein
MYFALFLGLSGKREKKREKPGIIPGNPFQRMRA